MTIRQSVRGVIAVLILAGLALGAGLPVGVEAAPPAQAGTLSLIDVQPATGTLDAATPEVVYPFECAQGGIASVRAETTSGSLEAAITVRGVTGEVLAQGGVMGNGVSVVEGFEMPAAGPCTVTLARVGETSGEYVVWLLPGYATLNKRDTFDTPGDPLQMTWEPYASESMTVATIGQQLQIQVFTDNLLGYAVPSGDDLSWEDFYIQAAFQIVGTPSYAEYGFVLRLHDEEDLFYTLTISNEGDWSLYWFDGEWTAIQDWTVSPAIDGADTNPTVGVWVDGYTFRVYFNGQFAGEVTDPAQHVAQGGIGVVGATGVDQADPLMVFIDNLVLTTPAKVPAAGLPFSGLGGNNTDAQDTPAPQMTPTPAGLMGMLGATKPASGQPSATPVSPPAIPTWTPAPAAIPTNTPPPPASAAQLTNWNASTPQPLISELQSLGLVPGGGSLSMNVPSSYGDTSSSGFSFYPLGQGKSYRNFVLSFDARLVNTGPASGCGMFFRDSSSLSNDALVFEDGSFLLGEWDSSGSLTDNSFYQSSDAVIPGVGATNRVTVVANERDVIMYVNGVQVAQGVFTPASGGVALEMYVADDDFGATVQTYCQLNNIWLWEF